jgi:hypothetical protein
MLKITIALILCAVFANCQSEDDDGRDGRPRVDVAVTLTVLDVRDIDDRLVQYETMLKLTLSYDNPPLGYNGTVPEVLPGKNLVTDGVPWVPNIHISNLVQLDVAIADYWEVLPNDDASSVATRLSWVRVFRGDFAAFFDFEQFPFDSQHLNIDLVTGSDENVRVDLVWSDAQGDLLEFVDLFHLNGWTFESSKIESTDWQDDFTGYFQSALSAQIDVEREPTSYVTQIVVPSMIMVMVSWAGFWISVDQLMPRLMPILIAALSQITLISVAGTSILRGNLTTFVEAQTLTSLFLIFFAALQLVTMHGVLNARGRKSAKRVDLISRRVFPGTYIILMAFLFLLYLVSTLAGVLWIVFATLGLICLEYVEWYFRWRHYHD